MTKFETKIGPYRTCSFNNILLTETEFIEKVKGDIETVIEEYESDPSMDIETDIKHEICLSLVMLICLFTMIKPTNGFSLRKILNAEDSDEHKELFRAMFYSNWSIDIFCTANSVYFESLLLTCQERALQEPVIESGNITDIVQVIGKMTRNVTIILSGRTQYETVLDKLKQMLLRLMSTFHVNLGPILNIHGSDYQYNSQRDVPIILSYLGKIHRLLNKIYHKI